MEKQQWFVPRITEIEVKMTADIWLHKHGEGTDSVLGHTLDGGTVEIGDPCCGCS